MLVERSIERVTGSWGKLISHFLPRKLILCYHNLYSDSETDDRVAKSFVGKRRSLNVYKFEKQLQWLSGFSDFVSLEQLFRTETLERTRRWQVAVTFDDGYRNTIIYGLPLFERYKVPITWFVCTEFVEHSSLLPWWDILDLIEERWHGVFEFKFGGKSFCYDIGQPKDKSEFRQELRHFFLTATSNDRKALHRKLQEAISIEMPLPKNGFVDKEEVATAAQLPWIFFGGHTVSHVHMAQCRENEVKTELIEGRKKLKEWTGQDVEWFAYPFGSRSFLNISFGSFIRQAGFRGAVTTVSGYVNRKVDRYQIPRVLVCSNWDMVTFQSRILCADVWRIGQTIKGKGRL